MSVTGEVSTHPTYACPTRSGSSPTAPDQGAGQGNGPGRLYGPSPL